jgi:hypothetical protein
MRAGVWYEVDQKIPPKTGYYLAFKGFSMGDDETECSYYYWNAKHAMWTDGNSPMSRSANVVYWTDADPDAWYQNYDLRRRNDITEAEKDAWAVVERALEQYEIVRALAKK